MNRKLILHLKTYTSHFAIFKTMPPKDLTFVQGNLAVLGA